MAFDFPTSRYLIPAPAGFPTSPGAGDTYTYNGYTYTYYVAASLSGASIPSHFTASPTNGETFSYQNRIYTFNTTPDPDEWQTPAAWLILTGFTFTPSAGGPTYLWDGEKWKASNIPDSSDVVQTVDTPNNGEVLKWNGSAAVWDVDNDTTYNPATQSADGLMSSSDKSKLDGIDAGANVGVAASGGTFTGTVNFNGNVTQAAQAVSALNIDCSTGNYFTKTISGSSTFTFGGVPTSGAYSFVLELTHSVGSADVTWPLSVKWPSDTAPTFTSGKTSLFVFVTDDNGSRWRGASLVDYTT